VNETSVGTIFKSALLAGLAAALVVAAFHYVVTEPIIEQSIAIEESLHTMEGEHEVEPVSRDVQRSGGLVIGFLLYGLSWALLFGVAFTFSQRLLLGSSVFTKALFLTVLAYLGVALIPFLKYPANPPGVGEPESIGVRQSLYIAMLLLSIAGTVLAALMGRAIGQRQSKPVGAAAGAVLLLVFAGILFVALPANPDPIRLPDFLVMGFRVRSLLGLTLFWGVLGVSFAWLAARFARPASYRVPARV
jgi:predicted cobalt transporter CbtA